MKKVILSLLLCLVSKSAFALDVAYFEKAAKQYNVPIEVLVAISKQESNFHEYAINIQGKGYYPKTKEEALKIAQQAFKEGKSFDIGHMQINVWWLKKYDITLETAIEAQNNVMIAAFILSEEIKRHGFNWKAIASYHTPIHRNPERAKSYAQNIVKILQKMSNMEAKS